MDDICPDSKIILPYHDRTVYQVINTNVFILFALQKIRFSYAGSRYLFYLAQKVPRPLIDFLPLAISSESCPRTPAGDSQPPKERTE